MVHRRSGGSSPCPAPGAAVVGRSLRTSQTPLMITSWFGVFREFQKVGKLVRPGDFGAYAEAFVR
jgi:hypothetical protein